MLAVGAAKDCILLFLAFPQFEWSLSILALVTKTVPVAVAEEARENIRLWGNFEIFGFAALLFRNSGLRLKHLLTLELLHYN